VGKLADFLAGIEVVEKVNSPINGEVSVVKSLAFGTYLQVANLTQSGGIIYDIWNKTLRKVVGSKKQVVKVLILGLGGGSLVKVVKKYWPASRGKPSVKITGVDIDPVMVGLGRKYLKLSDKEVKVEISDAYEILKTYNRQHTTYDLVLIDLYVGDEFPKKFASEKFAKLVRKSLSGGGTAVFNRLYYGEKRKESMKFSEVLEDVFSKVEIVFPEANVMFVCSK